MEKSENGHKPVKIDCHFLPGGWVTWRTIRGIMGKYWFHRDYWSTITDGGDIIGNGKIALSDRPGIGLELNEDVARAHQYPGTTWFA